MKKILLTISLISLYTLSDAQTPAAYDSTRNLQKVSTYGNEVGNGKFKNSLWIPYDTVKMKVADSGAVAFRQGVLYYYTGHYWAAIAGASGGVSSFSASSLNPLFDVAVGNATTTPSLSFSLKNTSNFTIYGRKDGGSGPPSFLTADSSIIFDLHSEDYYNTKYIFNPIAGTNMSITGTYPNLTFNATGGGSGTVTTVSGLSPLFTVSNATTTPTFNLSNATAYTVFGRANGTGVPSYQSGIDSNWVTGLHTEAYYNTKYALIGGGGGGGSVSDFSSGNLSPLFTTSVATSTSTPALTFSLSNTSQYKLFGRKASGSGAPSFIDADSSAIPDLHSENYYNTKYLGIGFSGWVITGNSGTTAGTNFMGTTDNVDVVFKRRGIEALRLANRESQTPNIYLNGGYNDSSAIIYADHAGFGKVPFIHTIGSDNLFMGLLSGNRTTSGTGNNTAYGSATLWNNTTGSRNTAIGTYSQQNNSSGVNNTSVGQNTLNTNTTGYNNTVMGVRAAAFGTAGHDITAIGVDAVSRNNTGVFVVGIGTDAFYNNWNSSYGVAIGDSTFWVDSTGFKNTAVGSRAGYYTGGNFATRHDSLVTFIGAESSRDSSISGDIAINNSSAVGYNSKVFASNQISFGDENITTNLFRGNVGIGTRTPGSALTIGSNAFTINSSGVVGNGTWNGSIINQSYLGTGGGGSSKFLREDNTWQTVSGGGSGTVNSGNQYRIGYYATTGTAISEAAAITANRALISDANGVPTHATTTATEIGYVNGVTSAIQTQLNGKQASGSYAVTTNNLSDLANAGTARTNLGLGQFAVKDLSTNIDVTGFWNFRADLAMGTVGHTGSFYSGGLGADQSYDLPNASGTIALTSDISTYVGGNALLIANNLSDVSNAGTARGNLGAAASGANTDITSLLLNQTGLVVKGGSSNALTIKPNETLSAARTLNIITGDVSRTLTFTGDASISGTNTGDQTSVTGNAGTATALQTSRAIYGNNFDGTTALTQIIASTYGGTGNGFTKFTGPSTSEKTFTLPNANATLLYDGGALGTPSSGTATNLTGTATGLTSGAVNNNLSIAAELISGGATTYNGSAAKSIAIQTGAVTNAMLANSAVANLSGTNTGDQNLFSSIPVSGQTTVTSNSATTALTFIAGTNITITTNNTTKEITFAASGGGSGLTFAQTSALMVIRY